MIIMDKLIIRKASERTFQKINTNEKNTLSLNFSVFC